MEICNENAYKAKKYKFNINGSVCEVTILDNAEKKVVAIHKPLQI